MPDFFIVANFLDSASGALLRFRLDGVSADIIHLSMIRPLFVLKNVLLLCSALGYIIGKLIISKPTNC